MNPAAESVAEPPDDWWRLYDDAETGPTGAAQALAANADLAGGPGQPLGRPRPRWKPPATGSTPRPTPPASARSTVVTRPPPMILEFTGRRPQTIWLFDDLLDVSYELDLFGHVRRSVEASRADAEAAQAARDSVKITVAAETIRAYVQVCALGEQLAVARRRSSRWSAARARRDHRAAPRRRRRHGVRRGPARSSWKPRSARPSRRSRANERAAVFQLTALLGLIAVAGAGRGRRLCDAAAPGDGADAGRRRRGRCSKRRPDVRLADRRLAGGDGPHRGGHRGPLSPGSSLTGFYGGGLGRPDRS